MISSEQTELQRFVEQKLHKADVGSRCWSALYNGSLTLSAILSTAAAIILKLDVTEKPAYRTDISAILAGTAALLVTLTATGSFDRKWRINRLTRNQLEQLHIDLAAPDIRDEDIRKL